MEDEEGGLAAAGQCAVEGKVVWVSCCVLVL